jgi:hypothetical protein
LLADPTPPLSVWFLKQSFDTAKECERARKTEDHEAELQMHDLAKSHAIETNMSERSFSYSGYSVSASRPTIRDSRRGRVNSRHVAALALVGWPK